MLVFKICRYVKTQTPRQRLVRLPHKNCVYLLFSNYWMRLSRIWTILQIKEGVIRRGRTPKVEVGNTLRDLQNSSYPTRPNSIIALLFIQNISVSPFRSLFFHSPKITQPRPQAFSVNSSIICSELHYWRYFDVIGSIICNGLHYWRHFDVIGSIICSGLHFWRHWFNIWSTAAGYGELCMWF